MNFSELKKLMGESGRLVIVENDKPAYVVMTAKDFLALSASIEFQRGEPENKAAEPAPKPGSVEKQPAAEFSSGKKSLASFVHFEDAGEALELQDITFEDLGIDELPE